MVFQELWAINAMAPPNPQQPYNRNIRPTLRGPQRYDGAGERQIQQAGRSATNLNAQASAQSFREASRPGSTDRVPQVLPQSPSEHDSRQLETSDLSPSSPSYQSGPVSPYAPPVSSPLNPTPSNSSGGNESRKGSHGSAGNVTEPSSPVESRTAVAAAASSSLPSGAQTPSQPLLRPPEMSHNDSTTSLARVSTPRSVRDLGTDYDRYYNPFATQNNSRNNSQLDLSSSLPRYNSSSQLHAQGAVTPADLASRLSNPFRDNKRASNPFLSANNTEPCTPAPERDYQEKSDAKAPVVGVTAIPPRSGTPVFISNADPEKVPFYPWVDDRLSAPNQYMLYADQKEDDDDMHMPAWDDDKKFKPTLRERFNKDNIINTIGMIFLLTGLFTVFIILPVVSYTGTSLIPYSYETPLDQMPGYGDESQAWAHVNDKSYPLLTNIRTGLIDPDTPSSAKTRKSTDGDDLVLVFSDEFNEKNRTFYPGDDPYWFAPDIWYGATQDLEWYDPDAVNTGGGTLQLQLDAFNNHGLQYRSGMLNSWNQLCFKGGVFEVSMSLPGPAGVHGLWPGAWTMGNLGRPGYLSTTEGMWPYTYDSCDTGITPNQSMTDGTSFLPGQRLPNCACYGEDHPTPGTGRGAPEIDIAEVSGDWGGLGVGVATQSFQVAPFDIFYYPNYEFMETPHYQFSFVNTYTGGPFQEAVSTTTMLNNDWYDGKAYQKYAFEYVPGGDKKSHITWFVGDDEMMKFDARAIGPNGNVQQRLIAEEPLSMILNLGFSHSWVNIDMANLRFPTVMRIDYVRWYQKPGDEMVTCDPPGYETTDYIRRHPAAYNNPNYTRWEDAGYSWPKNTLVHDCKG
ncbi:Beta-glucan synthesis-associated protein KRE6 [Fulvia fulva]|uniref:Beta-glucan synthesis-associated protein KRE6 n=1 Tax=Passalora fulva TaxID=5499 RepID=A0A9Q8L9F7_PASFU|nr:Beta-glucan synthesis-associated protein KRE6 [Fulvia fulva]UJO13308.1 Beta-glucan synthesis-associated protein KRE6 [Fulvia fulva]